MWLCAIKSNCIILTLFDNNFCFTYKNMFSMSEEQIMGIKDL